MKDRVFVGPDVDEALAAAAASLGLPRAELRYVVLDDGSAGGRGLKPTPARVAVLLQEPGPGPARVTGAPETERAAGPVDPIAGIRGVVRAVAAAGGLEIEAEVEESDEALLVELRGSDSRFFLEPDGRGELLMALEHLLQRIYGSQLYPQPLRLRCEGFRERRDQALAEAARQLAEAVRSDGEPRTMEPLNAYERRVVHIALQDEPGITTFSVGEGRQRRVTVAPRRAEEPAPQPAPGREEGDER